MESIVDVLNFNENAYFYECLNRGLLEDYINDYLQNPTDNQLLYKEHNLKYLETTYSFVVFKKTTIPTCIDAKNCPDSWKEEKIAYVFILLYKNYCIVQKKNASLPKKFFEYVKPVPYSVLSSLLLSDDSIFKKISMQNLDVSEYAMRNKTLESNNLEISFPTMGASNYYLTSYKILNKNNNEIFTLSLGTSRINKSGGKVFIKTLIEWVQCVVDSIMTYSYKGNDFTSNFAENINANLTTTSPTNILILKSVLDNYIEESDEFIFRYRKCIYRINDGVKFFNKFFSNALTLNNGINYRKNQNEFFHIEVKKERFILVSKILSCFYFVKSGEEKNVVDIINEESAFILTFADSSYRYANGCIFQDRNLKGTINSFIKMFDPLITRSISSEKGVCAGALQTEFAFDTLFRFVEDTYINDYDAFICDDLGTEFADHIGISSEKIALFVEKHKNLCFSASAFEEVIGQAQKNLGSYNFDGNQFDTKIKKLKKNYEFKDHGVFPNGKTGISRIRTKNCTASTVKSLWKNALNNPYLKKELFIVVDYISKSELESNLKNLCSKNPRQKGLNEAKAILWLLSSLASSCREMNISLKFICRN